MKKKKIEKIKLNREWDTLGINNFCKSELVTATALLKTMSKINEIIERLNNEPK